jgi:hypothetical protein
MGRPHKDGSPARKRTPSPCGVFIAARNAFCDRPQKWLGRCEYHLVALKADSLYGMLKKAKAAERRRILTALDAVQKRREPWTYTNDEGERQLAEQAELENTVSEPIVANGGQRHGGEGIKHEVVDALD